MTTVESLTAEVAQLRRELEYLLTDHDDHIPFAVTHRDDPDFEYVRLREHDHREVELLAEGHALSATLVDVAGVELAHEIMAVLAPVGRLVVDLRERLTALEEQIITHPS